MDRDRRSTVELVVRVSGAQEAALRAIARARGMTPEDVALGVLTRYLRPEIRRSAATASSGSAAQGRYGPWARTTGEAIDLLRVWRPDGASELPTASEPPLAWSYDGDRIAVPRNAIAWRVLRSLGTSWRAATERVLLDDAPLALDLDAPAEWLRIAVRSAGVYRLDPVDALGRVLRSRSAFVRIGVPIHMRRRRRQRLA